MNSVSSPRARVVRTRSSAATSTSRGPVARPGRVALLSLALGLLAGANATVDAHYRILATEDLGMLPRGEYRMELGAEYRKNETFPFSGLAGDYLQLGNVRFEKGLGEDATFILRGNAYQRLAIQSRNPAAPNAPVLDFTGNTTAAPGNFTFATKMRWSRTQEDRVGFGFTFAVEMPNTSNETGLGNDETNFFGTFIGEVLAGDTKIFANLGLGILGMPNKLNSQKDKILYGLGMAMPVGENLDLLAEVNGFSGSESPGTEDRASARLGIQQAKGDWRWDLGVLKGLSTVDYDWGVTAGVTARWGR